MDFKLIPGCLTALKLPMESEVRLGINYPSLDLHLDRSLRCVQDVSSAYGEESGVSRRKEECNKRNRFLGKLIY